MFSLEFFIIIRLKNNKNPAGKIDSYTRMLHMNPPLIVNLTETFRFLPL